MRPIFFQVVASLDEMTWYSDQIRTFAHTPVAEKDGNPQGHSNDRSSPGKSCLELRNQGVPTNQVFFGDYLGHQLFIQDTQIATNQSQSHR